MAHFQRNILAGAVTVIPILVTVFVFGVFVELLSDIGRPKVVILANAVEPLSPDLARWLLEVPWLSSALAIMLTLGMFYLLGFAVTRLIGRRILEAIEGWLTRIPLVRTVYGSTKKLIEAFNNETDKGQKVVLIEFPHSDMKAIGILTKTMTDTVTGAELAAVYVPTAPNPTGGYLEIVPRDRVILQDWTVDQAMTFIISGGTNAPSTVRFSRTGKVVASANPGARVRDIDQIATPIPRRAPAI